MVFLDRTVQLTERPGQPSARVLREIVPRGRGGRVSAHTIFASSCRIIRAVWSVSPAMAMMEHIALVDETIGAKFDHHFCVISLFSRRLKTSNRALLSRIPLADFEFSPPAFIIQQRPPPICLETKAMSEAPRNPPIKNSPIRLAVCVSGEGTTLQNLIDQIRTRRLKAELVQVVASKPRIGAIARAEAAKIPLALANYNARSRTEFSNSVFEPIRHSKADLVILAGFLALVKIPPITKVASSTSIHR